MPLVISPAHAYAFLGGLFIGKFTNMFSDIVITGLVLYIVTPEIYTEERISRAKNYLWGWFRSNPVDQVIRIEAAPTGNLIENKSQPIFDMSTLPKIELLSPNYTK